MKTRQDDEFPVPPLHDRVQFLSYQQGPYIVLTEKYLSARGICCGCGCKHCPFEPRAQKGNRQLAACLVRYLGGQSRSD